MTYARRIAQFEMHAAMVDRMTADLLREGNELVAYHHALRLAFRERTGREFDDRNDEFSEADERRAAEILELFPAGGA